MRILDVTQMLTVTSIPESTGFYRDALGFNLLATAEGWAVVARDGVEVMFALPNAHLPFEKPVMTGSLYFHTDDADAIWQELKDRCKVEYPMEDFAYGMREFAVSDNSGYLLQFGQRIG
jgi:uncharacterized glyoxalase superfamily protein PhnB